MKTAAKTPRRPVAHVQHGDLSQVWIVIDRPPVSAEAMAADARKRAAFYSRSPFWRDGVVGRRKLPVPKPAVLVQKGLFDA